MASISRKIVADLEVWGKIEKFITTVQEIAGTTNDPNTETNLYAAIDELFRKDLA